MMRRRPWWCVAFVAGAFGSAYGCSLAGDLDGLSAAGAAAGEGGAAGGPGPGGGAGGPSAGAAGQGGGAAGGALVFSDKGLANDFGSGTFDGTAWNGDHLGLGAGRASGRFVSRVFDAGATVAWSALAWEPGAPYRKALPGGGGGDGAYRRGAASMADNVLLLHFDESTVAPGTLDLTDASGVGHEVVASGAAAPTAGVFGSAFADGLDDYAFVPVGGSSGLNFGTSDFTWALWVKTAQSCPAEASPSGNRVHLGAEDTASDETHLWLGCTSSPDECPGADGTGRAGGTFCARRGDNDECARYCGRTVINDGAWHHLAVVKRGHAAGGLRLFVDGAPDLAAGDAGFAFSAPVAFEPGVEFAVGGFSRGTFDAEGAFDEVAVWRRALADDEVASLYGRGALGLALRVRVCARADCSDAEFLGPDGAGSAYLDAAEGRAPTAPTALRGLPPGRYFQYEVRFDAAAAGAGPALYAVDVFADRL